jgi:hypothetical protein
MYKSKIVVRAIEIGLVTWILYYVGKLFLAGDENAAFNNAVFALAIVTVAETSFWLVPRLAAWVEKKFADGRERGMTDVLQVGDQRRQPGLEQPFLAYLRGKLGIMDFLPGGCSAAPGRTRQWCSPRARSRPRRRAGAADSRPAPAQWWARSGRCAAPCPSSDHAGYRRWSGRRCRHRRSFVFAYGSGSLGTLAAA